MRALSGELLVFSNADLTKARLRNYQVMQERRVVFELSPEARAFLAKKGYDPVFGARPLARVIQKEVRDPLTDEILFGRLENGGTVKIGLDGEKLAFEIG